MKKNPPVCPSCGTAFDAEVSTRAKRGRAAEKKAAPAPEKEIEDLPIAGDDEADDTLIEDAEELGDNEMDEVVDVAADDE